MTARAILNKSELTRMAEIATERNVTVEITDEIGRKIKVSPAPAIQPERNPLAPKGGVRL